MRCARRPCRHGLCGEEGHGAATAIWAAAGAKADAANALKVAFFLKVVFFLKVAFFFGIAACAAGLECVSAVHRGPVCRAWRERSIIRIGSEEIENPLWNGTDDDRGSVPGLRPRSRLRSEAEWPSHA